MNIEDLNLDDVILITLNKVQILSKVIKTLNIEGDVKFTDLWISTPNELEDWYYSGGNFELLGSFENAIIKYPEYFIL